jgi:hypothetical protein
MNHTSAASSWRHLHLHLPTLHPPTPSSVFRLPRFDLHNYVSGHRDYASILTLFSHQLNIVRRHERTLFSRLVMRILF